MPKTAWQTVRGWILAATILFIVGGIVEGTFHFIVGKKADCGSIWSDHAKGVCDGAQSFADPSYTTSGDTSKVNCSAPANVYHSGFCEGRGKASLTDLDPSDAANVDCAKHRLRAFCQFNKDFVIDVKSLDPFNFAWVFYKYLDKGIPPPELAPYVFAQPLPEAFETNGIIPRLIAALYRAIPGVIYTSITVASAGWASVLTAAVALLFGFMAVRSITENDTDPYKLASMLLVPLVGGAFIWVLIQLMLLIGYLFKNILEAAQAYTVFSALGTTVWASFKKSENDATDRLINWSKTILFKSK